MLFISGQISIAANGELIKGKVGKDLKTEDGYEAAKRCGLNIISQVKKACNEDLSKIKSCVKLTGFVNSTEDFIELPALTIPALRFPDLHAIKALDSFFNPEQSFFSSADAELNINIIVITK